MAFVVGSVSRASSVVQRNWAAASLTASTADGGRRESNCGACGSRASGTDRPAPQAQACVAQPPI